MGFIYGSLVGISIVLLTVWACSGFYIPARKPKPKPCGECKKSFVRGGKHCGRCGCGLPFRCRYIRHKWATDYTWAIHDGRRCVLCGVQQRRYHSTDPWETVTND